MSWCRHQVIPVQLSSSIPAFPSPDSTWRLERVPFDLVSSRRRRLDGGRPFACPHSASGGPLATAHHGAAHTTARHRWDRRAALHPGPARCDGSRNERCGRAGGQRVQSRPREGLGDCFRDHEIAGVTWQRVAGLAEEIVVFGEQAWGSLAHRAELLFLFSFWLDVEEMARKAETITTSRPPVLSASRTIRRYGLKKERNREPPPSSGRDS